MADKHKTGATTDEAEEIGRLKQQMDILDQRLDNIDSMVTAVAERVMNQLVSLNMNCPHCGKAIEIGVVGSQKPKR